MARDSAGVVRALKKHGLSAYGAVVLKALEPAIRLVAREGGGRKEPLGRSKLGGDPHLATSAEWPMHASGRPMHFLAQICLSELPANHLPRGLLPDSGWLYFWWDSLGAWYSRNTRLEVPGGRSDEFCVTFEPDEKVKLSRRPFPEFREPRLSKNQKAPYYRRPTFGPYPELPLRLVPVMSIRNEAVHALVAAAEPEFGEDSFRKVHEFYHDVLEETVRRGGGAGNHRLFGDAFELQSDMREDCHRFSRATAHSHRSDPRALLPYRKATEAQKRPWQMLAVFDSEHRLDWIWGDVGELYFWIRDSNLAKRRFDMAHGTIQSS